MKYKYHILIFIIFTFFGIFITFPLIFHMDKLATGVGDEFVIAWTHNWVIHALTTNPLTIFEANLYFPYHNTLAYSDLYLTSSVLFMLPFMLIGQPIGINNLTLISSFILLGF